VSSSRLLSSGVLREYCRAFHLRYAQRNGLKPNLTTFHYTTNSGQHPSSAWNCRSQTHPCHGRGHSSPSQVLQPALPLGAPRGAQRLVQGAWTATPPFPTGVEPDALAAPPQPAAVLPPKKPLALQRFLARGGRACSEPALGLHLQLAALAMTGEFLTHDAPLRAPSCTQGLIKVSW